MALPWLPLALAACLIIGVVVWFWVSVMRPAHRREEFLRATRAELESLAKKRPPGVTRRQWHHVVAWTLNAHSNTVVARPRIPWVAMDQFESELERRLQGPVDLGTIDWIWDGFVRLAPGSGPRYSEWYRPTS